MLDLSKCWYGVGGAARKDLQVNLLRKYLNYTDAARLRVGTSGFVEALNRHAVEVVDGGFMQLFGVAAHAGKLLLLLLWALSTSVLVFPPLIIVLVAMVLRMRARERNATLLRLKNFKTYDMVMMHAENVTSNFELVRRQAETALSVVAQLFRSSAPLAGSIGSRRLSTLQRNQVRDYALRPKEALRMDALITDVNYFGNAVAQYTMASVMLVPTISTLFVGCLMAASPALVGDGTHGRLTIGTFLASLSAVKSMGSEAEALFNAVMKIQLSVARPVDTAVFAAAECATSSRSVSSLLKITFYMNMDTDLAARLAANRHRRQMASELREQAEKRIDRQSKREGRTTCHASGLVAADEMEIQLRDVHLTHGDNEEGDKAGLESQFAAVNLSVKQGRVVAVVGRHSSGKASLLRLMAGNVLPTTGEVFTPPHLRCVHVEQAPSLLAVTLFENLTLGATKRLGKLSRVLRICTMLGLSPTFVQEMERTRAANGRRMSATNNPLANKSEHTRTVARGLRATRVGSVSCALSQPVQDFAEDDMELRKQLQRMSWSDRCIVHLARALIAAPELLILHRPLAVLDEDVSSRLLTAIRAFVDDRGVCMEEMGVKEHRRPRTAIFTCTQLDQALKIADDVIVVGLPDKGATMYTAAELKSDKASALRQKIDKLLQETEHAVAPPPRDAPSLAVPVNPSLAEALGSHRRHDGVGGGMLSGRKASRANPIGSMQPRAAAAPGAAAPAAAAAAAPAVAYAAAPAAPDSASVYDPASPEGMAARKGRRASASRGGARFASASDDSASPQEGKKSKVQVNTPPKPQKQASRGFLGMFSSSSNLNEMAAPAQGGPVGRTSQREGGAAHAHAYSHGHEAGHNPLVRQATNGSCGGASSNEMEALL